MHVMIVWDVFHVLLGRTFVSGLRTQKTFKNPKKTFKNCKGFAALLARYTVTAVQLRTVLPKHLTRSHIKDY